MRVAVLQQPRVIEIENCPDPTPGPGDVSHSRRRCWYLRLGRPLF